jgi:hypothetical protein
MNFVRFCAKLARRGCSRAVARIAARRRLAVVCSAALAACLAGAAFTAAPAGASAAPMCLDADAGTPYPGGAVIQWQCNDSDNYQNWTFTPLYGLEDDLVFQIQNNGTGLCLDADSQQMYNYGAVIQWGCNSSDPYQDWIWVDNPGGLELETVASWEQGSDLCLDADAQQTYDYGAIIQWQCNNTDPYQLWSSQPSSKYVYVLQNYGA